MSVTPQEVGVRPNCVIGIGASAGGVDALRRVAADLPADLPAAVCVVLHIPATGKSLLAPILDREGALRAESATDGTLLEAGRIYVAPADHHLLVADGRVQLDHGPKENGARPAVDALFRSLAQAWGSGAIAVVLSGALDDGSSGVVTVAEHGGTVVAQDPLDAIVPGMPASAIATTRVDHIVPIDEIGPLLARLAAANRPEEVPVPAESHNPGANTTRGRPKGPPTGFTCPECSGALWEIREGEVVRYRCRVGHTYSEDTFVDAQASTVEAALWTALEVLEERAELMRRIADRLAGDKAHTARRFRGSADDALARAALIRRALATTPGPARAAAAGGPAGR